MHFLHLQSALTEPRERHRPGSVFEEAVHSSSMERRKSTDLDDLLDEAPEVPKGHDIRSLGPSDSSDTGADMVGVEGTLDSTTDRQGTGERTTVGSASGWKCPSRVDVAFRSALRAAIVPGLGI